MAQEITINEVIDYYENFFINAYADLVSLTADKPSQVLIEIENFNSHLMVVLKESSSQEDKRANLKKAKSHLQRGALDCYKLLFVELNDRIEDFVRGLSVNDVEFSLEDEYKKNLKSWHEFSELIRESRKQEVTNVGSDKIDDTIRKYKKAVEHGFDLYRALSVSAARLATFREHLFLHSWKAHWPLHVLEIGITAILTIIVHYFIL